VLGGDEIYPYATERLYRNQLDAPFAHALEGPVDETDRPGIFAIPGNHDWYGGLGLWRSRFTTTRGRKHYHGWQVSQDASWFSIRLPHGWWLWGIDTHLHGDINAKQYEYFEAIAMQLEPGDQVVICHPVPAWRMREKKIDQLVVLDDFIADVIEPRGASARLFLAGDAHVFAGFTRRTRRSNVLEHHVTSGGAGAFLHPTHNLSAVVPQTEVPFVRDVDPAPFVDGHFWPPPRNTHRTISFGAIGQLFDRQVAGSALVIAALHVFFAWPAGHDVRTAWPSDWGSLPGVAADFAVHFPGWVATLAMVVLLCGVGVGAATPNTAELGVVRFARRAGFVHGLAQAGSFFVVAVLAHWLVGIAGLDGATASRVALGAGGVVAALASIALLMIYLSRVNRDYRVNDNEAFSFRHLMDGKHFLRCHLDRRGDLTVRLIGVDRIHRGWADAIRHSQPLPPGSSAGKLVEVASVPWQQTIKRQLDPIEFGDRQNRWIAISASDPAPEDALDPANERAKFVAGLIAEAVLRLGSHLAYGGDPRAGGFIEEFAALAREPIGYRVPRVRSYRAVNAISDLEPGDLTGVEVVSICSSLDRAEQLTVMRRRQTSDTFARIVLAGKPGGAGIEEEVALSIEAGQPVFLVGGLGGATEALAAGHRDDGFARLPDNGLSREENDELSTTEFPHRIVYLVTRGLQELYR